MYFIKIDFTDLDCPSVKCEDIPCLANGITFDLDEDLNDQMTEAFKDLDTPGYLHTNSRGKVDLTFIIETPSIEFDELNSVAVDSDEVSGIISNIITVLNGYDDYEMNIILGYIEATGIDIIHIRSYLESAFDNYIGRFRNDQECVENFLKEWYSASYELLKVLDDYIDYSKYAHNNFIESAGYYYLDD